MTRIYHHYSKWEDWADGLYSVPGYEDLQMAIVLRAQRLLADKNHLMWAMQKVVAEWPFSAAVNLSNRSRNRQAWLGQASACMVLGTPEDYTKRAWHGLTPAERIEANGIADMVISQWEADNA